MAMLLKINLEEDAELRSYVKELIKSQVKAVAREEAAQIIEDSVNKRLSSLNVENAQKVMREEMAKAIKEELGVDAWGDSGYIKKQALSQISQIVSRNMREGLVK